ncbi:hypothetical protein HPB50_011993 [Hyalomma asiaticum]|uniref:Uncharacterized protein n=1 Tax=Hyalomma asiaticum TaxID=266040 RepID=A0ACB7SY72_HYAAI|nr:hypothetical protein HPB50_011993 [Hyalomma asiaticum]
MATAFAAANTVSPSAIVARGRTTRGVFRGDPESVMERDLVLAQPASSPSLAAAVPLGRAPSFSPFPLRQSFESHGKWRYSAVVRRGALNVPALFFRRVAASNGVRSREACRSETRSPGIVDNYLEKFGYIAPTKNGTAALRSQEALVDAVKEFQRFAGLRVTAVTGRFRRTVAASSSPRCVEPRNEKTLVSSLLNTYTRQRRKAGLSPPDDFNVARRLRAGNAPGRLRAATTASRVSETPCVLLLLALNSGTSSAVLGRTASRRVDNETAATMQLPRCGVRDKVGFGLDARRRRRRYALQGSKWASNELSYRISKYPRRVKDRVAVDKEIARAFKFVRGEHGDGDPFNGPGGTLAHAFFPRYGGDAHFDDEEKWTIDEYTGVNLFQVAAHEFGHSLGLSHSDVRRSLMAPFYRGFEPGFQLDRDDIDGVQALYGAVHRTTKTPSKGSRKPAQPGPDLCQDATIDAATRTEDGSSYVFKGDYYWKIETDGIADGYPRRISDDWGGLPGHIDAALTWSDGKTFFFKGGNYWRFRNKQMSKGYPQKISVGFQGIPDNLDAALVWSGNGKTYFFKGNQYWRYDSRNEVPVSDRYPQPVSNWNGVPGHLDAAFQWQNGYSYFFKGPNYYRFNDKDFGVDKGDPPYPRATSVWWFDCKAMSSAMAQQQASSRRHPESATAHVLDRTEAPMAPRIPVRQLGLQRDAAPEAPELGPVGHAEPPPPTTVAAGASTSFLTSSTAALVLLAVPLFRPLQHV